MRISRLLFLPQAGGATVHKFWRAHNKEFLLQDNLIKELYLKMVSKALLHKSVNSEVKVFAYSIMSNHVHMLLRYANASDRLSAFMRIANSCFGQTFNKIMKRQGSVAYDRPKTPLVQESLWNQMRVHFYIEANPLRARIVKDLKQYKFSSFRFYAWGIKDEHTHTLTCPQWYLDLGHDSFARQAKYRSLFDKYLREILIAHPDFTFVRFIGDILWVDNQGKALSFRRSGKESEPVGVG